MSPSDDLPFITTLLVRDTCLCLHVQRAARALARRYDEVFRPIGLTSGQFSLLMSLNRPARANLAEVAALLAMDRTTLTANLKPLERRGLVQVGRGETDKRRRTLGLTSAGRSVLAAAVPIWQRTHAAIENGLEGSSPDRLRADLRALHEWDAGFAATRGHSVIANQLRRPVSRPAWRR
jgi:DNA-binding MarR family transcriptional regulator